MAGSYEMARNKWSLIENMGDAHEAVEELLWLIELTIGADKAIELLDNNYYPMLRGEKPIDTYLKTIQEVMQA